MLQHGISFVLLGFNKEKEPEWDHRKEQEFQLSSIFPITFNSRLSLVFLPDPELWYFALRIQMLIILSEHLSSQKIPPNKVIAGQIPTWIFLLKLLRFYSLVSTNSKVRQAKPKHHFLILEEDYPLSMWQ